MEEGLALMKKGVEKEERRGGGDLERKQKGKKREDIITSTCSQGRPWGERERERKRERKRERPALVGIRKVFFLSPWGTRHDSDKKLEHH